MKYKGLEDGKMRELTPDEVCAFYHFHDEYAQLGLGAIEFYKRLSARNKQFIKDMTLAIIEAAQQSAQADVCPECKCGDGLHEDDCSIATDMVIKSFHA